LHTSKDELDHQLISDTC